MYKKLKITADKFWIRYNRNGDKILEEKFCGVWWQLREGFLKKNQPELYKSLIERGKLEEYLTSYQETYSNRGEKMAEKLAEEHA